MGRKKFEEAEYDPIAAEAKRTLARSLSQPATRQAEQVPQRALSIAAAHVPTVSRMASTSRKEKKRSFSCANAAQDSELDAFLLRIEEAAGTHVPFQVLMRAACVNMMRAEEQLLSEIQKSTPPSCPATFRHVEYGQFEDYWTDIMTRALRKVRPHQ